jgi:uncharacterized membrane protein YhfC
MIVLATWFEQMMVSYSQLFLGAISGDVFEQVVDGKTHIYLDKGPEGFLLIDPETQGVFE